MSESGPSGKEDRITSIPGPLHPGFVDACFEQGISASQPQPPLPSSEASAAIDMITKPARFSARLLWLAAFLGLIVVAATSWFFVDSHAWEVIALGTMA